MTINSGICDYLSSLNIYNFFIASGCQICPKGWLLNRDKCYYFKMESQAWSLAHTKCEQYGSNLVVIDDWNEQVISCSCLIIKHFPLLKQTKHIASRSTSVGRKLQLSRIEQGSHVGSNYEAIRGKEEGELILI